MAEPKEQKPAKRVEVTLTKPHTHAGVSYDDAAIKQGVTISVTERQRDHLKSLGKIQ